jgi:hypothetical protein
MGEGWVDAEADIEPKRQMIAVEAAEGGGKGGWVLRQTEQRGS